MTIVPATDLSPAEMAHLGNNVLPMFLQDRGDRRDDVVAATPSPRGRCGSRQVPDPSTRVAPRAHA